MPDFATLKGRVQKRLIDVTQSVGDDVGVYVNLALRDIQDTFNFPFMRAEANFTAQLTTRTLGTMPGDFKELRGRPYYLDTVGKAYFLSVVPSIQEAFKLFSPQERVMTTDFTSVGAPRILAPADYVSGDDGQFMTLNVYPLPDANGFQAGGYVVYIPYWRYLPELSDDADENWFTTYGEQYIVEQAMGHAFMDEWAEDRAASRFQVAAGYRKKVVRRGAYQAVQPMDSLAVRSDVNGSRESWRSS